MPYTKEAIDHLERQRRLFLVLNVIAAISFVALYFIIRNETHARVSAVQRQRYDTVYASCIDQNTRHDQTLKELNHLIKQLSPERRVRAKASKQFTILLIDALAPKRNCLTVANQATAPRGD